MSDHYIYLRGCVGDNTINFQLYTMAGTEGRSIRDYLSRLATSLRAKQQDYTLYWTCTERKAATEIHDDTNLQQTVPLGTVINFAGLTV